MAKKPTQSKYLAQALKELAGAQKANPQSWGEALARVGQSYFAKKGIEKYEGAEAAAASEKAKAMAAILFPNDPRGAALLEANPEAITGALSKGYEPQTLSEGQTLLGPGAQPQFTAPKTGIDDGRGYRIDQTGMQSLGELAPSYGQQTGRMGVEETMRHNPVMEQIGQGQLGVAQGNLGVRRQEYEARLRAGGFGTPGVGGVLGPQLGPEWEIQP